MFQTIRSTRSPWMGLQATFWLEPMPGPLDHPAVGDAKVETLGWTRGVLEVAQVPERFLDLGLFLFRIGGCLGPLTGHRKIHPLDADGVVVLESRQEIGQHLAVETLGLDRPRVPQKWKHLDGLEVS